MKITKLFLATFAMGIVLASCKKDDETAVQFVERDRNEVYVEDLAEIEEFLTSHTFNYAEFQAYAPYSDLSVNPPTITPNDSYEIVFTELSATSTDLSIMDFLNATTFPKLEAKIVNQDGFDYTLYLLKVREGLGEPVHALDATSVLYKGTLANGDMFDSAVVIGAGQPFHLTRIGNSGGVVRGFRESLVEFKGSEGQQENGDGSTDFYNHGIGAGFVPSGLGYFSAVSGNIDPYTPIFFRFRVISRNDTDYDFDGVPSHIEDLDGDGDGFNDDTDGDGYPNFVDQDDDGDGVLTRFEDIDEDGDPTNDDTNGNGTPNYLDPTSTQSIENN